MKDKLVKTGHKKPYYRFIGALRGIGFSLLAVVALASPVAIAMGYSAQEAHAEETSHVAPQEESSDAPSTSTEE
ncbi:MAG: hypothetical protein SPL80_03530 [Bacilli bacterium]|nr:hypothetical protein [Bacilli bacterium]